MTVFPARSANFENGHDVRIRQQTFMVPHEGEGGLLWEVATAVPNLRKSTTVAADTREGVGRHLADASLNGRGCWELLSLS